MTFRDKVRRVFHRSSSSLSPSSSKNNGSGKPKIEYYKRGEIPRSKFRGPFDPEHQKKLAAWSFEGAMAERSRSLDLPLSPCATVEESICPLTRLEPEELPPDRIEDSVDPMRVDDSASIAVSHDEYAPQRKNSSSSQSSATMVDEDSLGGSILTLIPESEEIRQDSIAHLKEAVRYSSPILRPISPPMSPKGAMMPFSPDDLTRALNAVQIVA